MKLNLSADEVLTTTRSVRKRLDFDRPVEREVVEECLEIALQAPTGSNRQGWHWVVVEDPARARRIADDLPRQLRRVPRRCRARRTRRATRRGERQDKVIDSASYLADNFHRAPLMLIPCLWGRLDGAVGRRWRRRVGLAAPGGVELHARPPRAGLGSAWTTIHLMNDGEQQVAELLGIPFDKVTQGGLFPIAYTIGTDFKPAKREPLDKVLHWDRW